MSGQTLVGSCAPRKRKLPPGMSAHVPLVDVDEDNQRADVVLGFVNLAVLVLLVLVALVLALLAISPTSVVNAVMDRSGPFGATQRLVLLAGAALTGGVALAMRSRYVHTLGWARLPTRGALFAGETGITVRHRAVLDDDLFIPWVHVRVITLDSGEHHDHGDVWRRFPVPGEHGVREFLFATDGKPRPDFALIASRPVAPNVAIVLASAVEARNPNFEATNVAFAPQAVAGMPARPPAERSTIDGLFLRVRDLVQAREALQHSGRVRSLRAGDVAPVIDLRTS